MCNHVLSSATLCEFIIDRALYKTNLKLCDVMVRDIRRRFRGNPGGCYLGLQDVKLQFIRPYFWLWLSDIVGIGRIFAAADSKF